MFSLRVIALAVIGLGFACVAAADAPVDVYVLSGQSNMRGLGRLRELHPANRVAPHHCSIWNGDAFVHFELVPSKGLVGTVFGPELSFCHAMALLQPDRRIYLIKYAEPASGLHHGWRKREWLPDPPGPGRPNFYPGTSPADPNVGELYAELRTRFSAAIKWLDESGTAYALRGILWMQGETDAVAEVPAIGYAGDLARLKNRLEEDLGKGSLPLVFGQALPRAPAGPFYLYRNELRQSQAHAHWNSGHPDAIEGAWMVSTDGMPVGNQRIHYTVEGQIRLGHAMAVTMLQLQNVLAEARQKARARRIHRKRRVAP